MEISGSLSMIITWMSLGTCGTMMGKMEKDTIGNFSILLNVNKLGNKKLVNVRKWT
jgi:hypothetical protein